MPTTDADSLRADSARVRARMLAAARQRLDVGVPLPMNAIAKEAGVGVGTMYRHFPSQQALLESLAADSFETLVAEARAGAADPDSGAGLARLLRAGLREMRRDPSLAAVLAGPEFACAETEARQRELGRALVELLDRARADGAVRADVTPDDLRRLMCGLQHALASGGDDPADRYLDILLTGLRADNPEPDKAENPEPDKNADNMEPGKNNGQKRAGSR